MTRHLLDIGAPATVTHDSVVGNYDLVWDTLSGITIPDEYLSIAGDTFLRYFRLLYDPSGTGGSSTYTSLARFQTATTDSGTGSASGPQMSNTWEKRDVAFTIIVGGNRYDVRGPDALGVPSAADDQSEPYYWRFSSGTSLEALTRAVQEANAATRAAIQLELDNGLDDGVVLLTAIGTGTWTVPAGVTSIRVELVGGGGGGGGGGSQGQRGRIARDGVASELVGHAISADYGRAGAGGGSNLEGQNGRAGSPGRASSPGISGSGTLSGSRDVSGLEAFGHGGQYGTGVAGGRRGGSGGGGAYWITENYSVTPGQELSFKVGARAAGGGGGSGSSIAGGPGNPGTIGTSGAVRITYDTAVAPSFSDNTGDAQSWVRNTVISSIPIPRVAQGAPTPAYTSSGVPTGITVALPTATADGSITGTPTLGNSGTITITATNASGTDTWTVAYNIVLDVSAPSFSDATGDAQTWSTGNTISNVIVPAASGTPTPSYAVRGSLPAGLSFNASTRTISGTPTSTGSGTITIRATNSEGSADWTVAYAIAMLVSFPDDPTTIQDWSIGTAISDIIIPVAASSVDPTYAVVGSLPDGITFDAGTRTLSGTPTTSVNVSTIIIRATNSLGNDDYSIRYLVRRASPTQTITLPISEYELQFSIIKDWQQAPATPLDFDLAPPGVDLWLQGLRVITNGQVDIRFANVAERQSTDHTGDDLSDQFERQGQFILRHGTNVLTLNMVDTSDSDEPYTWQGDAAGATFFRSIPSAGTDITLTIRDKAPVAATLSASASTGVPLARAALIAAVLSASAVADVPTAQASLAPPTISMKASANTPNASANLLPGQPPFDLSWTSEGGRTVYVSAVVTAGAPRGNGTVYENQPGRTPLGSVSAGSDMESQTGQSVTAIALNELFTGNITFWDAPSPLAWSTFFTDNPDVSLWMQFAPSGPVYPFVSRGHGGSYSAWATGDTAAQAAVTAARAEGARFAFVLRGAPAVITLSASSTAGVPTARANLQQPILSISALAATPTARAALQGQLLSATASAGVPTATINIEEQGVGINAYVPPSGYWPIVLAFLEADVSGGDITAEPVVTIGTGNDLIVASDLVISQVERHVAGAQIRLRRSGGGEFSTYFDNEGSPLYPDARLQILYDRSLIDGSIANTGGGFNNWSVANSAQRSKLNAIATGERFVLAILKKVVIEASASAIAPTARVALVTPSVAVDASAGVPSAKAGLAPPILSVSVLAGTPTARADLVAVIISISVSVGTPTARAALIPPTISLTATTNTPTAKARLASPTLSASASAATPTARARLASLVLTTADIDITNLDVYALALINTGTPTGATGTIYRASTNLGSIDAGGDLTARPGQDITRIGLNPQGSGTVRFWDNPSEQSWINFFSAYPRATLRLQFEITGPAYGLTRGGQGGNFSNWSTTNADARAAIASARADGKKFIFLLAEERIAVRAGEGEKASVTVAGAEGIGRKIDAATRSGSGEFGESATEGEEGTGNSRTVTGLGEGEVGRVTASAVEGQGASVVIRKVGSGEFGRIVTEGAEGVGAKITLLPATGSGEFGNITTSGKEGRGRKEAARTLSGTGEFGSVIASGKEGTGAKFIPLPTMGSGEFASIITSGKEGVGRRNAARTLSGVGEFGTVSSEGTAGGGRFGGSLAGFIKIAEVRGISFPRTGLKGNVSYDVTLRSRDRTGNTGNLVPAGTVLTEDLLDVFGAEFIFRRNNTGVVPDRPISSDAQRKTDNYIPAGWTDNPQGVDISNRYEYISSRTGSPGKWSDFGVAGLYDIFVVAGDTEAQFIFRRTSTASAPNTPPSSAANRANDSYVPFSWSATAQGTTETLPYEWASYRLKTGQGIWSPFYPPTLREAHPTARGPIPFFRAISGSSWSNSEANTATTGNNVTGDRVTLYNSTAKWTATRVWNGSRWITIGKWIDGNLIVEGSILSIFDIVAGAAVESSTYRAGKAGWRIAQDGGAEFDAAVIRGVLTVDHIDGASIRSSKRLSTKTATLASAATIFTLGSGWQSLEVLHFLGSAHSNKGSSETDNFALNTRIFLSGEAFRILSKTATTIGLASASATLSKRVTINEIWGIKDRDGTASTPGTTDPIDPPDPSSDTTTDTDTIYRLSASTPSTPSGGTTSLTHTPSGWSRTQPSATTTQGVYRATRTRTYTDGSFTSATAWGSVTQIQSPSGSPLTLPAPSDFNAPLRSTTSVTLPAATGGTGNYRYSISGALSSTGANFSSSSRSLRVTPTSIGIDSITYTVTDGVNSVSQSFTITRTGVAVSRPGTPGTPTLSSSTSSRLVLACPAPTSGGAPTTYRWRISTNSSVSNSDPMHTSSGRSITITGLSAGTNYWVDVRAENSAGNSGYSGNLATSTASSTSQPSTLAAPVLTVTNTPRTKGSGPVIGLSWPTVTGATGYQYRGRSPGGSFGNWVNTSSNTPRRVVLNTDSSTFSLGDEFQARAYNATTFSAPSNTGS